MWFIAYVEQKLREHGLDKKVVPPDEVIDKRAEEQRADEIMKRAHDHINSILDTGGIVTRIIRHVAAEVEIHGVPDCLEEWAGELQPEPWSSVVDDKVHELVSEHDDTILKMVRSELIKHAAEIDDGDKS